MKPTSIAFISGLYKQVCGTLRHTNPNRMILVHS